MKHLSSNLVPARSSGTTGRPAPLLRTALAVALFSTLLSPFAVSTHLSVAAAQEAEQVDMMAMMERAKQFTEPSDKHKFLERFIGTWDTEFKITMAGMGGAPAEKGVATFSWLIDGRWMQSRLEGTIMGTPSTSFYLMGYDNFKQSYITVSISSFDTALIHSQGDLDPSGKALISYGTLDEYLTGEHDKMVKSIWRFVSDDEMVLEIHDLPIGEKNTQVMEMRYKRKKAGAKP